MQAALMRQTNFIQAVESEPNRLAMAANPGWYGLYTMALLESDRNKALRQIELAQRAIDHRQEELDQTSAVNPREVQELTKASTYLEIMLRNVGTESERLLWD
jgi:hypothetical protein